MTPGWAWFGRRPCLLALLPTGLALIFYVLTQRHPFPFPDCHEYMRLAEVLGDEYSLDAETLTEAGLDPYRRTPGYPFCIALFRVVAGRHAYFLVNLLCFYGVTLLTLKLALKWSVPDWPLVAVLFCLSPGLLTCTTVPLTEIAFTFWIFACIYLLVCERSTWAALCLSMAVLTRPIGVLLFVPFGGWLFWKKRPKRALLVFVLLANVLPLMWVYRNYLKSGHVVYTTISNYNILHYKVGRYLAYKQNKSLGEIRTELNAMLSDTDDPVARSREAKALGIRLIKSHFWGFCFWAPRNLVNFLMPDITPLLERLRITQGNRGTYDVLNRSGFWAAAKYYFSGNPRAARLTVAYLLYYALFLLMLPVGLLYFYRRRQFDFLFFVVLLTVYFAVLPLGSQDWRFRMSVTPLLFFLVAGGCSVSREYIGTAHRRVYGQ